MRLGATQQAQQNRDDQARSRFERSQKFPVKLDKSAILIPNPVGNTANASYLSKHIALIASYCSLFISSFALPSFFKENSIALWKVPNSDEESAAILNYTLTPAQCNRQESCYRKRFIPEVFVSPSAGQG